MRTFADYAYYYDLFYGDKDYQSEAQFVKQLIETYLKKNLKKVLSMGCGTGRHDIELAKMGYGVTGIDISSSMIEIAKKNALKEFDLSVQFEVSDIRTYISKQKFDVAVSLFHVMSYQNKNEDLLAAFSTANRSLKRGGGMIFDVWYGPGVLNDKPTIRIKRVEDDRNLLIRYADPVMHANTDVVDVNYDILIINKTTGVTEQIKEVHHMRYYFEPELEYMLKQTGFELVACVEGKSMRRPDYQSWTAYFCAIKVDECKN